MKPTILFSSLFSAFILCTSCKKEDAAEAATTEATTPVIIPNNTQSPATIQNFGGQPGQQTVVTAPGQNGTVQMPQQVQMPTKAGMNPAHGQPGHRCDIAVGAPLNSPVKAQPKTGGPATITQQTITPQSGATPNFVMTDTPTKPGMNPPHGQPGHVCGTPVGSPLSTATTTTTETPTDAPAEVKQ